MKWAFNIEHLLGASLSLWPGMGWALGVWPLATASSPAGACSCVGVRAPSRLSRTRLLPVLLRS